MKTPFTFSIATVLLSMLLLFASCRGSSDTNHPLFGRIPHILSEYTEKEAYLLDKRQKSQSFKSLSQIDKELNLLRQQTMRAFNKEYEQLEFPITISVDGQMDYPEHRIQQVYISDILPDGRLKVTVHSIALKDSTCPFAYGRFERNSPYESLSEYIVFGPISVHRGREQTLPAIKGSEVVLEGFLNCARAMQYASKLELISEQEYMGLE